MNLLHEAAQQAVEALEEACEIVGAAWTWRDEKGRPSIDALRAALAQKQAEPAQVAGLREKVGLAYGYLWCVNNEPGAPHRMPPEHMAYEARKLLRDTMTHHERGEFINRVLPLVRGVSAEIMSAALAQEQAEPEGSVCARCGALAFDPVVPQAEPLTGLDMFLDPQDELKPKRYKPKVYTVDGKSAYVTDNPSDLKEGQSAYALYPEPFELVPLTEGEIMDAFHAARNAKLGASQDNSKHRLSVLEIARAVEKASWEKNHG